MGRNRISKYGYLQQGKGRKMTEVETSQFWTQAEGEGEVVRTFAKIPEGYTGKLSDLSGDDEVFFWLTPEEWIGLGAGSQYGDVDVLSCACEECESERYAEYWVGEYE